MALSAKGLLRDPLYSDLTLECNGREWRLHKCLICSFSSFFKKACEGDWEEAKKGIIRLPDDEVDAVDAVIQYCYTGTYTTKTATFGDARTVEPVYLHALVFALANKLMVADLVVKSKAQLKDIDLDTVWKSTGFAHAIRELYLNAPEDRPLRSRFVSTGAGNANDLLTAGYGAEFRKVVDEVHTFGTEFKIAALSVAKGAKDVKSRWICYHSRKILTLDHGQDNGECPYCFWAVPGEKHGKVASNLELPAR